MNSSKNMAAGDNKAISIFTKMLVNSYLSPIP